MKKIITIIMLSLCISTNNSVVFPAVKTVKVTPLIYSDDIPQKELGDFVSSVYLEVYGCSNGTLSIKINKQKLIAPTVKVFMRLNVVDSTGEFKVVICSWPFLLYENTNQEVMQCPMNFTLDPRLWEKAYLDVGISFLHPVRKDYENWGYRIPLSLLKEQKPE
jgi:hypothetical protein